MSCPGAGSVMSGGEKWVLSRWRSDVILGTLFAELVINLPQTEALAKPLKGVWIDSRKQTFPRILPQYSHTPRHLPFAPRLAE
jgi:hypothetical protein